MWLYVPCQSVPGSAESNSASNSQASNSTWFAMWRGKPTLRRSWPRLLMRNSSLKRLSGLTCEASVMRDSAISWKESNLTSCAGDTPANHSASQVSSAAQMMSDIYGRRLLRRLARIGRRSVFLRTSQLTLPMDIPKCEPTFEQWATELRKDCSRRASLAQTIVGSDCLSLPWATALTNMPERDVAKEKRRMANRPKAGGIGLQTEAKQWATPTAMEYKGSGPIGSRSFRHRLDAMALDFSRQGRASESDGEKSLGEVPNSPQRLNPAFVCWLMGFPWWWTNIEIINSGRAGTLLSHWRRRMRGYFCGLICSMAWEAANG